MVKASHNQELKAKIDQNNADQTQESVPEKPPQPRAILACGQKALELELMSCNFNSFPSGDKLSFILYQFEQPSLEIFTHSFGDNEQPQAVINAMFMVFNWKISNLTTSYQCCVQSEYLTYISCGYDDNVSIFNTYHTYNVGYGHGLVYSVLPAIDFVGQIADPGKNSDFFFKYKMEPQDQIKNPAIY